MNKQFTEPEMSWLWRLVGTEIHFEDDHPRRFRALEKGNEILLRDKQSMGIVASGEPDGDGHQWFGLNSDGEAVLEARA